VEAGHHPVQLLAAAADEDPRTAADRIDRDLLAAYIPAATKLGIRRGSYGIRMGSYHARKVTRWTQHLAHHLQWQAQQAVKLKEPPRGMSGIDLVPHLMWPIGGRRLVRVLHSVLVSLLVSGAFFSCYYIVDGLSGNKLLGTSNHPDPRLLFMLLGLMVAGQFIAMNAAKAWPREFASGNWIGGVG
jgi:hypothetical protein